MKKHLFSFFKYLIALAAIVNLVLLFVFDYKPFDQVAHKFAFHSDDSDIMTELPAEEASVQLYVPSTSLSYNGTDDLDLLDGVYVMNADGSPNESFDISASLSAGNSRLEKIVEYTTKLPDESELTGTRILNLGRQYIGPSIIMANVVLPPFSRDTDIDAYVESLVQSGIIKAQDGFGNDISSDVKGSVEPLEDEDETASITLSVSNEFGDAYSTGLSVPVPPAPAKQPAEGADGDAAASEASEEETGVVMRLTKDKDTIPVGSTFSFYDYIADCHDAQGNDLHKSISVQGDVDTSTPGTYTLKIYCRDGNGVQSPVRTLTVTVQ